MVDTITKDNFSEKVHHSEKPVLVDFFGDMCQPCKQLEPVLEELAVAYEDKLQCFRINILGNQEIFAEHGVASVPTLIIFVAGEPKAQTVGFHDKEALEKWLHEHI